MTILVTGGLGFIGTNFIKKWNKINTNKLICVDNNRLKIKKHNLIINNKNNFYEVSIGNRNEIKNILKSHKPDIIINFAAESHVDHSISCPSDTYFNNVYETAMFLEEIKDFYLSNSCNQENFQFLQISTDEVYGSADQNQRPFIETDILNPQNPYSASKAACEHMIHAFGNTYGIPYKISRCSNNFGPYQSFEKFIPTVIKSFLKGQKVPIYGDGLHIRDWLYVDDHVEALISILKLRENKICLNIGANNEITNKEIVRKIATVFDELQPIKSGKYLELIKLVQDRPGHDRRYSVSPLKLTSLTKWKPKFLFEDALRLTVSSYLTEGYLS